MKAGSAGLRWLVPATVFLTGGAVMVVELLGVRLISPVFGTGLHVWAALISVALAALALGYFAGGALADRHPRPLLFFGVVTGAAAGVLAIPLYAPALIPAFESAGLRTGALLAAAATFFPPLFLLGCASPFAVRISATAIEGVGGTAGRLYAISTLGSVAGTLAAGFLLVPLIEIDVTLRVTGAAVGAVGVLGMFLTRGIARAVPAALLVATLASMPGAAGEVRGGVPVFSGDSPYQRVEVVDRDGERWLILDGCVHTHLAVEGGPSVTWGYIELFSYLPGYRPEARTLLSLGVGGGALVPLLEAEEYEITAVELDPVVLDVAERLFGTMGGVAEKHVADARPFVRRIGRGTGLGTGRRFDLVALDVCGSDRIPEHLTTVEFFREVDRVLAPGGVLALNAIGHVGGRPLASLRRTLAVVFEHVECIASNPGGPLTNVVYYASHEPLVPGWAFEDEIASRRIRLEGGEVLTDLWNPINHWNAPWAREIRRTRAERY